MEQDRQRQLDNYLAALDTPYDLDVYIDGSTIFVHSQFGPGYPINTLVFSYPHGGEIHEVTDEIAAFIESRGFIVSRINHKPCNHRFLP